MEFLGDVTKNKLFPLFLRHMKNNHLMSPIELTRALDSAHMWCFDDILDDSLNKFYNNRPFVCDIHTVLHQWFLIWQYFSFKVLGFQRIFNEWMIQYNIDEPPLDIQSVSDIKFDIIFDYASNASHFLLEKLDNQLKNFIIGGSRW